jgi:hypothetical protein
MESRQNELALIPHPPSAQQDRREVATPSPICPTGQEGGGYPIPHLPNRTGGRWLLHPPSAQQDRREVATPSPICPTGQEGGGYPIPHLPNTTAWGGYPIGIHMNGEQQDPQDASHALSQNELILLHRATVISLRRAHYVAR